MGFNNNGFQQEKFMGKKNTLSGRWKFIAGALLLLTLAACEKDHSALLSRVGGAGQVAGVSVFPNTVGDEWTYFYFDSLAMASDTVRVQVAGKITTPDSRQLTFWTYQYSSRTDTQYVEVRGDTVRMFADPTLFLEKTRFVFPLKVGKSWKGGFVSDSSRVVDSLSVTVAAGSFPTAFVIEETWAAFNDYGIIHTYFVPEVGIVKKHHRGFSFGLANNYWELLSYRIKK